MISNQVPKLIGDQFDRPSNVHGEKWGLSLLFTYFKLRLYYFPKSFHEHGWRQTLCIANCDQTAADSVMLTTDSLHELTNALRNYHHRPTITYHLVTVHSYREKDKVRLAKNKNWHTMRFSRKSIPTVEINLLLNVPSVYRCKNVVLPTPESPAGNKDQVQILWVLIKNCSSNECYQYD